MNLLGRALRELRVNRNDPTSPLNTDLVAHVLIGDGYLSPDQPHSLLVLASAAHTTDIEVGWVAAHAFVGCGCGWMSNHSSHASRMPYPYDRCGSVCLRW